MNKKVKKWIQKHHAFINITIAVLGLALFLYGNSGDFAQGSTLGVFLSEVGIALITNALLLFVSLLYFKNDDSFDNAKHLYEEKGIVNVYDSKKAMNERINNVLLPNYKVKEYDILCCGGLTTLRKEEGKKLIGYIKDYKMRIRILTANPHLGCLLQQKIDEERELVEYPTYKTTAVDNSIMHSIFDLYDWVRQQRSQLPEYLRDNLQIKFYRSLPSIQLHRIGNQVFVGQSVIGKNSQSSPSFEFENTNNPNDFFSVYTQHFEMLWNDPNYAQDVPNATLDPQLLINDKVINNILKLACLDLASDLGADSESRIGASLTVCGFPRPLEDGRERRYNTNIVRGNEIINVQESNGITIGGNKIGYDARDEKQVVGRCIASGETRFEVTKEASRYSILAIPFKNLDGEVIAAVSFEFDCSFNQRLCIGDLDLDIRERNAAVISKADKWATLLSVYLRISD